MLKEVEQKGGRIYGVKGGSIEGKQIGWLSTANLSQHRLKSEKKKKTHSLAKDSTLFKEEGALTSVLQQKKNQCVSSVQIMSKIGFLITWNIHCVTLPLNVSLT